VGGATRGRERHLRCQLSKMTYSSFCNLPLAHCQHEPLMKLLFKPVQGANSKSYEGEEVHDFLYVRDEQDPCQACHILQSIIISIMYNAF
jgi:hypothetical protein